MSRVIVLFWELLFSILIIFGTTFGEIHMSPAPIWSDGSGYWVSGPEWGDFNNDGWLDLFISGGIDVAPYPDVIFYGSDNGFSTYPDWTSEFQHGSCMPKASDLDSDGFFDLVIPSIGYAPTNAPLSQVIYYNQDGFFPLNPDWISTTLISTWLVMLGDVDLDGDMDILFGDDPYNQDNQGTVKMFYNNQGSFNTDPDWESDLSYGFTGGRFADVDLDGDLDVAMSGGYQGVSIFYNNGGELEHIPSWASQWPLNQVTGGTGVAFGDLNGDGYPELAVSCFRGNEFVVFTNHSGSFNVIPEFRKTYVEDIKVAHVEWADADGDDDLDLTVVQWQGSNGAAFCIYENIDGVLSEEPAWSHNPGGFHLHAAWGDYDNDYLVDTTETFISDGIRKLFILDKRVLQTMGEIFVNGVPLELSEYCYDLKEGWLSIGTAPQPGEEVMISYTFSRDLDLAAGTLGTYLYENLINRQMRASYEVENYTISDANNNNVFESSEVGYFRFEICNLGLEDTNVDVTLNCNNPDVIINNPTISFSHVDGDSAHFDNFASPIEFIIPEIEEAYIETLYITIESDNGRLDKKALFTLTLGWPDLILVDDNDNDTDYEEIYRNNIDKNGIPFTYWNIESDGIPLSTEFSKYKMAIWLAGDYREDRFSADEIQSIKEYLDSNGRLFLSGCGLAQELSIKDQNFLEEYIHCRDGGVIPARARQGGMSGSEIGYGNIMLKLGYDIQDLSMIHKLELLDDSKAEFISNLDLNKITGLSYWGKYRVAFFDWGYEAVLNNVIGSIGQEELMTRILSFLSAIECGDANNNSEVDILDVIYLINYIYREGPEPIPIESGNTNNDEDIDILDVVQIINFVYKNGPDLICPN